KLLYLNNTVSKVQEKSITSRLFSIVALLTIRSTLNTMTASPSSLVSTVTILLCSQNRSIHERQAKVDVGTIDPAKKKTFTLQVCLKLV
ncbi:10550_t:CDS:1, partial [Acaulospora morrowiae]